MNRLTESKNLKLCGEGEAGFEKEYFDGIPFSDMAEKYEREDD